MTTDGSQPQPPSSSGNTGVDRSEIFVARYGAVLAGIFFILFGVATVLSPTFREASIEVFFTAYRDNVLPTLADLAVGVAAVFALAVVPAVTGRLQGTSGGWLRWITILAVIGFAALALTNFRQATSMGMLAEDFLAGEHSTQVAVLQDLRLTELDPLGIFQFAGVGLWLLLVNRIAQRRQTWPQPLALLGMIAGLLYLLAAIGTILDVAVLTTIGGGAGVVIAGSLWFIWLGLTLPD